jgi:DNA-binding NarL/FixJ family response regulator
MNVIGAEQGLQTRRPRRRAEELAGVQRRLHGAESVAELFAEACDTGRDLCGFDRALILSVEGHVLTADSLGVLRDPASDALRRRVLRAPIPIRADAAEAELIRDAAGGPTMGMTGCAVKAALDLQHCTLAAIRPDDRVLALLVMDRAEVRVTMPDVDGVELFAHLVGHALERLFLRLRMRELQAEFRHLTASALAALKEAVESPVSLPRNYGSGPVFAAPFPAPLVELHTLADQGGLLTERERQIAEHIVAGRSNREIAAEMHLSPDTVKGYVARIVRKLGATNRVDAVARYLRLTTEKQI